MKINWITSPADKITGKITVPGDKSISHRSIMFGSIAEGITEITGFLDGEDCLATLNAFQKMGVLIERTSQKITVHGQGLYGLKPATEAIDLGNSGTSMRLMAGILAGQDFSSTLIGDQSLMSRPMKRVTDPLIAMGAEIKTSPTGTAPLEIHGSPLHGINFQMTVASAQLKSCLLLAGLYGTGTTKIHEYGISRDHSERMLKGFGVKLGRDGNTLMVTGGQKLIGQNITVPGDISSAAFFIVAGLIAGKGELLIENVGINPTRAAVIEILQQMGGEIILQNLREMSDEPVADILVRPSRLHGIDIPPALVPIAIDEFPIIFIAAACAEGKTYAQNLKELRVKESDRLAAMEKGLIELDVHCQAGHDTMVIYGNPNKPFSRGCVLSFGDHRIAMSFAIAGLVAEGEIEICDCANVATSFPQFIELAKKVGLHLEQHEVINAENYYC